jgi:hypothetical protein
MDQEEVNYNIEKTVECIKKMEEDRKKINKNLKDLKKDLKKWVGKKLCFNRVYIQDDTYGVCHEWSYYGYSCPDCM